MSIAIGLGPGLLVPPLRQRDRSVRSSGTGATTLRLGAFVEKHARRISLVGLVIAMAGLGLSLSLWAGERFATPPVSFIKGPIPLAAHFPMALAYSVIGSVLASRQPRNLIGWLFLGAGVSSSVVPGVHNLVAAAANSYVAPGPITLAAAWATSSFHLPIAAALLTLVFLVFPDGRAMSRRWWIGGGLAVVGGGAVAIGLAIDPRGMPWYPQLPNPFGASWAAGWAQVLQIAGLLGLIGGLVVATAAMIVRYRSYPARERQPLKWMAVAMLNLAMAGGSLLVVRYGLRVAPSVGELLLTATILAATLLPIAAGVGMLRHHLFDTDLILNHALVYVPLSGLMTGLYAASVALFQRVFVALTGDTSDVAIVLTTLILATTFTPVRKMLEAFVDRHFKPAVRSAGPVSATSSIPATSAVAEATNAVRTGSESKGGPDLSALIAELHEVEARLASIESARSRRRQFAVPTTS